MRIHLTSFLLGVAVGAGGATLAPRLRGVALEIATSLYKIGDAVVVRAARRREDLSDLLAEARARARGQMVRARSQMARVRAEA